MEKKLQELSLKTHAKIHTYLLLGGLVVTAIGGTISEQGSLHLLAWIGIVMVAVSILWRILFIKCPHCGSGLYGSRSFPEYCPDCGEKLI